MTTSEIEVNPQRDMARARKAVRMADVFDTDPHIVDNANAIITALSVAEPEWRERIANQAGVTLPSEATWAAFLAVMVDRYYKTDL